MPSTSAAFLPAAPILRNVAPRPPTHRARTRTHTRTRAAPRGALAPQGAAALPAQTWFKLICGASSHDVPTIANLSQVYAQAGADCIDVAAHPAVALAARAGIARAVLRGARAPLLMVSLSDGPDVHFRKATFDPALCPSDCPRPCVAVCPADAIVPAAAAGADGVVRARCYGCGRCEPACPRGLIVTHDEQAFHSVAARDAALDAASAVEIHTAPHRLAAFHTLWATVLERRVAAARLRVVAVSLPDLGDDLADALDAMYRCMRPALDAGAAHLVWQTDGRPMSGDVAPATAKAAVRLAARVQRILTQRGIPGHVQLAGGTNDRTVPLMREASVQASGVAMGGYARKVARNALGADGGLGEPMTEESLQRALQVARPLVQAVKQRATTLVTMPSA